MQLTHYNSKFKKQKHPITIICDNITNAPNIGSLFRAADAFSIEKIIFCGDSIPIGKRMTKTSRSTEKFIDFFIENSIDEAIESLKPTHQIIALEITQNSAELHRFKFDFSLPIALVIGDENFGVRDTVLEQCHHIIHINMFGNNSSMNVVQATSIALYEITRQLHS